MVDVVIIGAGPAGTAAARGTLGAGIFNIGGTSLKIIGVQVIGIGACFLYVPKVSQRSLIQGSCKGTLISPGYPGV